METISLTSKVLHRLGSLFIGTPESLGMPADFYTDVGDREQPLQNDIRKREVMGAKLLTNVFRLAQTYRVGPVISALCFIVIFGLSAVSVQVTKWGTSIKTAYTAHETKVAQQEQTAAIQALGDVNAANCAAQADAIQALYDAHKPIQDWSGSEHALMSFSSNCAMRGFPTTPKH